jgi:hypothetical protein
MWKLQKRIIHKKVSDPNIFQKYQNVENMLEVLILVAIFVI